MHNEIESVDLENAQAEELRERLASEDKYEPGEVETKSWVKELAKIL